LNGERGSTFSGGTGSCAHRPAARRAVATFDQQHDFVCNPACAERGRDLKLLDSEIFTPLPKRTVMALQKNAVGNKIFVWSRAQGAPSPGVSSCIISSHGGQAQINGMQDLPPIQLVYYCPNGFILNQQGIQNVVKNKLVPSEVISANRSPDYELTKLQSDPNFTDVDNYNILQQSDGWITNDRTARKKNAWDMMVERTKARQQGRGAVVAQYSTAIDKSLADLSRLGGERDIVTIRDRRFHSSPRLSEVIKDLRKFGYHYSVIHCVFCRCPDANAQSYKPQIL